MFIFISFKIAKCSFRTFGHLYNNAHEPVPGRVLFEQQKSIIIVSPEAVGQLHHDN